MKKHEAERLIIRQLDFDNAKYALLTSTSQSQKHSPSANPHVAQPE